MNDETTDEGAPREGVSRVRSELVGGTTAGVFLLTGGWFALGGGSRGAAAAVILWSAALAVAGLGFGRPMTLPSREVSEPAGGPAGGAGAGDDRVASARRSLNLSERVGLGPLAGFLGGAVVAAMAWAVAGLGLVDLLGVDAGAGLPDLGRRLWTGAVWGLLLGIFYPRMPGGSAMSRGVIFSFIPAVWALLVEYPFLRGQGWAGADLGGLTFVLVLLLHLVWGTTVGAVFQWGELTSEEDLDRPLGAAA